MTTQRTYELVGATALLAVAAIMGCELLVSFPTNAVAWLIGIVVALPVADVMLTRAVALWGRSASELKITSEGVSGRFRPDDKYRRAGSRFALHTVLFRLPLPGFDRPNFVAWTGTTVLRIMPGRRLGYPLRATLSTGPPVLGGPNETLGRLTMWLREDNVVPLVESALRGGSHVHVDFALITASRTPILRCPLRPSLDPRFGGVCLQANGASVFLAAHLWTGRHGGIGLGGSGLREADA